MSGLCAGSTTAAGLPHRQAVVPNAEHEVVDAPVSRTTAGHRDVEPLRRVLEKTYGGQRALVPDFRLQLDPGYRIQTLCHLAKVLGDLAYWGQRRGPNKKKTSCNPT